MTTQTLAVVGAGVVGRLLALRAASSGITSTLYDAGTLKAGHSCSSVGAGMLAPCCELEHADSATARLGEDSAAKWQSIVERFGFSGGLLRTNGSLVVAHPRDEDNLQLLIRSVVRETWASEKMFRVTSPEIHALEPQLGGRFSRGLHFPGEGHVDNDLFLSESARILGDCQNLSLRLASRIEGLSPRSVTSAKGVESYDWVADCRGLGSRDVWPELRGVRGELVLVDAPEVHLNRPVRLMHPRYPLYVVPRADHRFVIGATMLESEDHGPVTVQSALELLSAAYAVHPGFAEARIVAWRVACRPALPHNQPRIRVRPGLVEVNGLFRHGFLLSPILTEAANAIVRGEAPPAQTLPFIERH
jgi:glycine oxidase